MAMRMRVLMTGGYGCIGSWVAKLLLDGDHEVAIFDLKEDTHRIDLLLDAEQKARLRFIAGDVTDLSSLRTAAESFEATHLLHLAGLQVPTCRADPMLGAKVNVLGTLAVFETAVALAGRIERVVYASSAAVHGPADPDSDAPIADDARLAPLTHYGAFKVCNELNARVYHLEKGVSSVGLRPWTVYGVGRDFGITSEPTKAILAVAAGRPYAITYGGLQDLQYVRDVAEMFILSMHRPFEGAEAFNVRGAVVPIEEFTATLRDVAPESAQLVTHGTKQLPIAPSLDDSRFDAQLGPLPRTPLRDGIAETLDRFRSLVAAGKIQPG